MPRLFLAFSFLLLFSFSLFSQPEAWAHFLTSEIYRWRGDVEKGLEELKKALELDPSSLFLRKEMVRLYLQKGEEKKAEEMLEKIYRENPRDVETGLILSSLYIRREEFKKAYRFLKSLNRIFPDDKDVILMLIEVSLREGEVWKANLWADKLQRLNPSSSQLTRVAEIYMIFGVEDRAEEFLRESIGKDSQNIRALLLLGDLLEKQGKLLLAGRYFRKAIGISPFYPYSYERLGEVNIKLRRWDEAIQVYKTLLLFQPRNDVFKIRLAYVYMEKKDNRKAREILDTLSSPTPFSLYILASLDREEGKIKEAEEHIKKALELKKDYFPAYILLSMIYRENDFSRAEEILREGLKVVKNREDRAHLFLSLGLLYMDKSPETAVTYFYKASRLYPSWDAPYFHLGASFEKEGNWEEAEFYLRKAISLNPNNAEALNYLGYMYADRGIKLRKALKLIRKALQIEPDNGYYVDSLGWVYYRMGKLREAEREIKRAIRLLKKKGEDDPVVREHLGDIYWRMGRVREAVKEWEESLKLDPANKKVKGKLRKAKRLI